MTSKAALGLGSNRFYFIAGWSLAIDWYADIPTSAKVHTTSGPDGKSNRVDSPKPKAYAAAPTP